MYLAAIIGWYSRYVPSWEVSISLDADFCIKALKRALLIGKPEIFNTDQGVQFTSGGFIGELKKNGIRISMDARGGAFDNIFVERLWRSLKYEEVYINSYESVIKPIEGIKKYFNFYNMERLHQALNYKTPYEVYSRGLSLSHRDISDKRYRA